MSGVVEGFRWTMLGKPAPGPMLAVSVATVLVMLASGSSISVEWRGPLPTACDS